MFSNTIVLLSKCIENHTAMFQVREFDLKCVTSNASEQKDTDIWRQKIPVSQYYDPHFLYMTLFFMYTE